MTAYHFAVIPRAAAVMTLIPSAKLNGHDPDAYLKGVLTRPPTHKNNSIDELLPHNWKQAIPDKKSQADKADSRRRHADNSRS